MLPFLDRGSELRRLRRALDAAPSFAVVLGRRRLGKSRLIVEALREHRHVYYVGDARDAVLQRRSFAAEVAGHLPGFDAVDYPDWDALLARLWTDARGGLAVAIDELPELVARSPELPSVLSKRIDGARSDGPTLIVAGSSQRMMRGLVLDASAPLYGRATEILEVEPLPLGWLGDAFGMRSPSAVIEHHAAWGGVPRYWELARGRGEVFDALEEIVLDPLGPLHREPERLLLDEMTDVARPASILSLIGRGAHRVSEIGGRLGIPATSLSRPIATLMELGYVAREVPFGRSVRDTKRTLYRLRDPFLRTWYRFVEPNRSRLGAGLANRVRTEVEAAWPRHVGEHWEAVAREALPHLEVLDRAWGPPSRWWGRARDGAPIELDLCAAAAEGDDVLVAEAKRTCSASEARSVLDELERKAALVPDLAGRRVHAALFVLRRKGRIDDPRVIDAARVVAALR